MAALLLAAAQAAAPAPVTVPTCSLVTPRGDAIGFFMWSAEAANETRFSATSGSAWPAGTVVGTRQGSGAPVRFRIGAGQRGFVLELSAQGAQRAATLFSRDGERSTLPVAYGYCDERPAPQDAPEPGPNRELVGVDHQVFNPALWPDDCRMILSDGQRVTFDMTMTGPDYISFEGELWSGERVGVRNSWTGSGGAAVGSFNRRNGPQGVQMMFIENSQAAKLVRFRQLGVSSRPNVTGYGICGIKEIVRRPNVR